MRRHALELLVRQAPAQVLQTCRVHHPRQGARAHSPGLSKACPCGDGGGQCGQQRARGRTRVTSCASSAFTAAGANSIVSISKLRAHSLRLNRMRAPSGRYCDPNEIDAVEARERARRQDGGVGAREQAHSAARIGTLGCSMSTSGCVCAALGCVRLLLNIGYFWVPGTLRVPGSSSVSCTVQHMFHTVRQHMLHTVRQHCTRCEVLAIEIGIVLFMWHCMCGEITTTGALTIIRALIRGFARRYVSSY